MRGHSPFPDPLSSSSVFGHGLLLLSGRSCLLSSWCPVWGGAQDAPHVGPRLLAPGRLDSAPQSGAFRRRLGPGSWRDLHGWGRGAEWEGGVSHGREPGAQCPLCLGKGDRGADPAASKTAGTAASLPGQGPRAGCWAHTLRTGQPGRPGWCLLSWLSRAARAVPTTRPSVLSGCLTPVLTSKG